MLNNFPDKDKEMLQRVLRSFSAANAVVFAICIMEQGNTLTVCFTSVPKCKNAVPVLRLHSDRAREVAMNC